jgi:putative Holliday junction resolvase
MALDVGDKWIGIAISDELRILAKPLEPYRRSGRLEEDVCRLIEQANRWNATQIVVGLPLNMNHSLGPQAEKTLHLMDRLGKKFSGSVVSRDERLTTRQAERILVGQDVRRDRRKHLIDSVAASLILEGFLNELRINSEKEVDRVADDKDPNNDDLMADDGEIITLTDEEGNEHEFVVVDVIEVDMHEYAILLPVDSEEEEEAEAVILRLEKDADGDDILVDIDSEQEWEQVAQAYEELLEEDTED